MTASHIKKSFQPKTAKPQTTTTVYNAYNQSWVFDSDTGTSSNNPESPYLKIIENGTPKHRTAKIQNGNITDSTHLIDNPVVHIEEASDDSNSNSDRKLGHMRSFSRAASPVLLSASSSRTSLHQAHNPPIYDCLETIYRSRLGSRSSNKEEPHYQAPQTMVLRRVESISPQAEKTQYASLMKELQKAIVCKKEPSQVTSPQSTSESATGSERTQTDSKGSESCKNSDAEFSKELEAALQLIQDLESPNTVETPSEPKSEDKPLAVWRHSDASESEKTLSAVGSIGEMASPLGECQPDLYTFRPSANGKGASVIIRYPDSQSTSGYSSPSHPSSIPTPTWSTTSSLNGSNNEIGKPLAYSIHKAKSATVISLYSQVNPQSKGKSVTLVNISGDCGPILDSAANVHQEQIKSNGDKVATVWNVKSLLRKKKQSPLPKLCPELEGAIIKSESLAYLSELELLARHQRNKEIQRVR